MVSKKQCRFHYKEGFEGFGGVEKGGKTLVRRGDLDVVGSGNGEKLNKWLFENDNFSKLIPKELVTEFHNRFKNEDSVYWSHPLSMLLTLSVFSKQENLL